MAGQPLLRRVFDRAERAIGQPLEGVAQFSKFTDVYLTRKRVERTIRGALDRPTGAQLHFINIPARTDVRRVNRQLAALTEEVRTLSARLDEQQPGTTPPPAPKASPSEAAKPRPRPAKKPGKADS
jgi:hypothetical protein